ncbi:hypothetical protein HY837_00825 [archaeon]|nr:hypothetical protein [archaeon]
MVRDLRKVPSDAQVVMENLEQVLEEVGKVGDVHEGNVHYTAAVTSPFNGTQGRYNEELVIFCTRVFPGRMGQDSVPIFVEVKNKDDVHFRTPESVADYAFKVAEDYEARNPSTVVSVKN